MLITATLAMCATGLAAWVATDRSREAAADLALALEQGHVMQKVAAPLMGLSEAQLTEQLNARQPLNMFRLEELFAAHPAVESAFYALRAERRGLTFIANRELSQLARAASRFLSAKDQVGA